MSNNIKVMVRVRPLLARELLEPECLENDRVRRTWAPVEVHAQSDGARAHCSGDRAAAVWPRKVPFDDSVAGPHCHRPSVNEPT